MANHVMRYYTDKGKHSKQNRVIARREIDTRIKKRDKTRLSGTFLLSIQLYTYACINDGIYLRKSESNGIIKRALRAENY